MAARVRHHAGGLGHDRRPRNDPPRDALRGAGADGRRRAGRSARRARRRSERRAEAPLLPAHELRPRGGPRRIGAPPSAARHRGGAEDHRRQEMKPRGAAGRIYTLALRAFPARHRSRYAAEMLDAFECELALRAVSGGRWSAARYLAAAWADAIKSGFEERRRISQGRHPRRGGVMRTGMSWLDVKLGIRMLLRYPGLSLAGGLGIVLVVLCGTLAGLFDAVINGSLPFDQGDRIVAIENWDTSRNQPAPHDFDVWRGDLKTVQDLGAYRLGSRNVGRPGLAALPGRGAAIKAATFNVAPVPPRHRCPPVPRDVDELAAPVPV